MRERGEVGGEGRGSDAKVRGDARWEEERAWIVTSWRIGGPLLDGSG